MTAHLSVVADDDALAHNADLVSSFTSHYRNDESAARRSLAGQTAEMFMTNIRNLWQSGAWRDYRNALGEFHWLEHEFDYFCAAQLIEPRQLADLVRRGDVHSWADLIKSTNPGKPGPSSTRRPFDAVESQLRRAIPGGYDPARWLNAARNGFGDSHDQQIAKSAAKVRQAAKTSLTQMKKGEQCRVNLTHKRRPEITEAQQQAEMILGWLADRPAIARLVKKEL